MKRALALALLFPLLALAGNQDEERLSDSVRSSLQAAIADRAVPVLLFRSGADNAHKWLSVPLGAGMFFCNIGSR